MSHKHAATHRNLRYRGPSGLHTGSILIMMGLALTVIGGYIPGIIIITIGAVITLDYFLLHSFARQTSARNKHRAKRLSP